MIRLLRFFTFLISLAFLVSCTPPAVVKKDVDSSSSQEREKLVELRKVDKIDSTDIARVDNEKQYDLPRSIREIKGGEIGVKLYDSDWEDFTINLSLNVIPLRTYFQMMQKLTGLNFIVGEDVQGDVSINLQDVGWVESLDIILKNKNLISEVNTRGNVITIHTHEFTAKQSESLKKALSARVDAVKAYSGLEPKVTSIIRLYYTKPDVISSQLKEIISSIEPSAGEGGQQAASNSNRASFVVDNRSNSIIIQATITDMDWIKSAIANLDKPTKQVLVEVFIVEGTDDFQNQLGSRVGLYNNFTNNALNKATIGGTLGGTPPTALTDIDLSTNAGSIANNPVNATGGALGGIALVAGGDTTKLRLELQAMQKESLIKIVSNPKLFILDNEEAKITDGQEVPYSTTAQLGATPSVQFKNASLQLQVKPSVIEDGNIFLDLTVNKDTPLGGNPPPIAKKELKTKLLIKDGGIALIGGINKSESTSTENGIPILKDLPVLGNFFKNKGDIKKRNQLYIFLAPQVL